MSPIERGEEAGRYTSGRSRLCTQHYGFFLAMESGEVLHASWRSQKIPQHCSCNILRIATGYHMVSRLTTLPVFSTWELYLYPRKYFSKLKWVKTEMWNLIKGTFKTRHLQPILRVPDKNWRNNWQKPQQQFLAAGVVWIRMATNLQKIWQSYLKFPGSFLMLFVKHFYISGFLLLFLHVGSIFCIFSYLFQCANNCEMLKHLSPELNHSSLLHGHP
jgi:hypothetical protein